MTEPGAASWRPDPDGRYDYRWWDGHGWTDQVSHQGRAGTAPLSGAGHQPQAGQHQAGQHQGGQHQGGQHQGGQHQAGQGGLHQAGQQGGPQDYTGPQGGPQQYGAPQHGGQQTGDGFAGITGDLVDGRFSEKEDRAIANQNSRMLRVRLGEPFMARQGAMVAYQGNVEFAFEGGGATKFLKKAFTGEGLPLMRCQGQGDVFLAEQSHHVHVLNLTNSGLSISGKNVLAFSQSLEWNIERVKGGSMAAGGLFNTTFRGSGWIALTTDGPPVVLNAAEAPTFADTDAIVAWSASLQTSLKSSFKAGALIGRGSGEALQVAFHGQGFVIVQPSEGVKVPTQ
ncbi:MAG: AIM24 family protein [Mycobacterium sp.]